MLDVDVSALSLWLERDALPKVSDADPSALAEYILALLDTIDLSQLSDSTQAECVAKLSDFFDSHTAAFVSDLFDYIRHTREKAAASAAPPTNSRAEQRSSRRGSRSRSPERERSRSRSRSRSRDRESRRRGRGGAEEREENGGHAHESRRSTGTLLIRDDRYGIKRIINRGGEGGGGAGGGWRREVREEDREGRDRDGGHRTQGFGGHQASHRPSQSSAPLVIARPYVPPPIASPSQSRSARSVHLPASNPYGSSPSFSPNPPFPQGSNSTAVVHVGRHTVVKRKRQRADGTQGGADDGRSSGGGVVLLTDAPRFVLSMRMLTDHFSQFGALKGVEIDESGGAAEIRYASQEEAEQATLGPPLHPAASLTLKPAGPHLRRPLATAEEAMAEEDEEEGEEETADGEEDASHSAFNAAQSTAVGIAPTISVGRHTLTLKPKPPPPPTDVPTLSMVDNHTIPPSAPSMTAPAAPDSSIHCTLCPGHRPAHPTEEGDSKATSSCGCCTPSGEFSPSAERS